MHAQTDDYKELKLCGDINKDTQMFKNIFIKDDILRIHTVTIGKSNIKSSLIYMDGMADSGTLDDSIVRPLVTCDFKGLKITSQKLSSDILFSSEVSETDSVPDMLSAILYGDTLLLTDGNKKALTINTKGWRTRGINEPADERILQGPREGFDEAAILNLAMIRRKLLTPDLCVESLKVGRRTQTLVFICYLGTLADEKTVKELKKRIGQIDIDGILDSNYITELIRDHKGSLLKTTGTTERPDIVAARLLEGRIAVVVDGTPVVLTLPYLFSENFQSDEDYYLNYKVASVGRILRYICFFISVSVPAIFVALTTFHLQLLPTSFALSIAQLRGGVPVSSVTEAIILILVFEILKETGLRTPQSLGQALGIVGGLVVGQAAVDARIVSAPMLIAVSLSGISGLMIPRLKGIVFYLRLLLVISCALFGLYGYAAVFSVFIIKILSMTSFDVDYTVSLSRISFQSLKDTVFRFSWTDMKNRPVFNSNLKRMRDVNKN